MTKEAAQRQWQSSRSARCLCEYWPHVEALALPKSFTYGHSHGPVDPNQFKCRIPAKSLVYACSPVGPPLGLADPALAARVVVVGKASGQLARWQGGAVSRRCATSCACSPASACAAPASSCRDACHKAKGPVSGCSESQLASSCAGTRANPNHR